MTVTFEIGDAESSAATLAVGATTSNPLLLHAGAFAFSGAGSNRSVTITPATNASGIALVTLLVTDPQGSTSRRTFYLTVVPVVDPVLIVTGPASLVRVSGEPASFSVVASSSLLPLAYQWFHDGTPIAGKTNSLLTFSAVSSTNAGAYFVEVSNADDSITSAAAMMTVKAPFQIVNFTRKGATNAISFTTTLDFSYIVEFKNALDEPQWQSLPSVPGTGGTVTVEDPTAGGAMRFYRVRVEPVFRVMNFTRNGATNAITFATRAGFNYTVEFKNLLDDAQWQALPPVSGTGNTLTVEDPASGGAMRFYRVRAEPAP